MELRRTWTADLDGRARANADREFPAAFADWWVDERERRTTWLAVRAATPVGMINLVEFRRMPRPGHEPSAWGYIGNLYVRAADRRHGIGRRLLAAVVTEAGSRGYERLVVHPTDEAVPLYRRAGFAATDTLLVLPLPREGR